MCSASVLSLLLWGCPTGRSSTVGLAWWTTSSTFSSSSTTLWLQDLSEFDFVEPYSVRFTSISTLFSGRPSGIASSSTLVTSATLGDFFDFYVGGVTHLLAWWVLSSKTALCRGLDSVVYLLVFLFELYGNLAAGL